MVAWTYCVVTCVTIPKCMASQIFKWLIIESKKKNVSQRLCRRGLCPDWARLVVTFLLFHYYTSSCLLISIAIDRHISQALNLKSNKRCRCSQLLSMTLIAKRGHNVIYISRRRVVNRKRLCKSACAILDYGNKQTFLAEQFDWWVIYHSNSMLDAHWRRLICTKLLSLEPRSILV